MLTLSLSFLISGLDWKNATEKDINYYLFQFDWQYTTDCRIKLAMIKNSPPYSLQSFTIYNSPWVHEHILTAASSLIIILKS